MIKATMEWVDIPIVLYTRAAVESQREARQVHGADEFVLKRSGPAALVLEVSRCSAGPDAGSAAWGRSRGSSSLRPRRAAPASWATSAFPSGWWSRRSTRPCSGRRRERRRCCAWPGPRRRRSRRRSRCPCSPPTPRSSATATCWEAGLGGGRARHARAPRRPHPRGGHRRVPAPRRRARSGVERTSVVTLAPMTEAECAWYAPTGEPLDKAGGYHVDGRGRSSSRGDAARPRTWPACPCAWWADSSARPGSSCPSPDCS